MRIGGVVWLVALAACQLEATLQVCGDLLCPTTAVCIDNRTCASAEDASACLGMPDGTACATREVAAGVCRSNVCVTAGCGNGVIEPGEMCDDGNVTLGDGCSADCRSNEQCGNGVLDYSEPCDDGGYLSGDGCSSSCREERLELVTIDRPGPFSYMRSRMVYFAARQQIVYVTAAATWIFEAGAWRRGPTGPEGRYETGLAYDEDRQRVVLHGGGTGQGLLSDTWEYDGTSWTKVMNAGGPLRRAHSMAYDAVRKRVVLFGGRPTNSTSYANDTWTFDGTSWTRIYPTGAPTGRWGAALVWDPSRQALVLAGGVASGTAPGMWQLDATGWTQLATSAPAFSVNSIAYDPVNMRLVGFAGGTVYETSTTTWTALAGTPGFLQYDDYAVAYDTTRSQLVMFGGDADAHWELGASWVRNHLPRPSLLDKAKIAFETHTRRLIVRGDSGGAPETWAYNPDGTWAMLAANGVPQPPVTSHIVYDPVRRRTVALGDSGTEMETWVLENDVWTKLTTTIAPPRRHLHYMAYDRNLERVVLFGGSHPTTFATYDDTWTFANDTWTLLDTPARPEARDWAPIAYDYARQRVVVAGGLSDYTPIADTWELQDRQWVETEALPVRRGEGVLAYDPVRRRSVLLGGWEFGIGGDEDVLEFDGMSWLYQFATPVPDFEGAWSYDVTYDPFKRAIVAIGVRGAADDWALGYFMWRSAEQPESCDGVDDLDGDGQRGCADPDCFGYCDPTCPPLASCSPQRARCGDGICDPALETHDRCAEDCP